MGSERVSKRRNLKPFEDLINSSDGIYPGIEIAIGIGFDSGFEASPDK